MASDRLCPWRTLVVFAAFAAAPVACGGFVETGGGVTRLTVGAEGGTLETDGFALVIPAHALGMTVTLSAERAHSDSPAGPAFAIEPASVTFDQGMPAEVRLAYDGAAHPHALEVFAAILQSGGWQALPPPVGDVATAGSAHGTTTTVGTFGVLGCPGGVCATPDAGTTDASHD